jgi:transposase-like protein
MIDKDKYLELYDKHGANVAAACKAMGGMSRNTFYLWYREDEDFKERADAIKESLIDHAESKLQELIEDGNVTACIFYLKTKGKSRGYSEKSELELSGGSKPVQISIDLNDD